MADKKPANNQTVPGLKTQATKVSTGAHNPNPAPKLQTHMLGEGFKDLSKGKAPEQKKEPAPVTKKKDPDPPSAPRK